MSFLNKLKRVLYSDRSDAWKAAVNTALWVFIAGFISASTQFLSKAQEFVTGDNVDLVDDLAIYGKALLSASLAMFTGLLNYLFRLAQAKNVLPGAGPAYSAKKGTPLPPPPPPVSE